MTIKPAINVFSVHEQLGNDYFGTLAKLAEAGYSNIEMIGFNMSKGSRFMDEHSSEAVQTRLSELGLNVIAAHEGPMPGQSLASYDWNPIMTYYEAFGCTRLVLPSVWLQENESGLLLAEELDALGKKMKERGFQLYVHNHAHEFLPAGDTTLLDILVDNTDAAHLKFELDMVWAMRAGQDPVQLLERLGKRCDLLHQKDISANVKWPNLLDAIREGGGEGLSIFELYQKFVEPGDFVDLGKGAFDFAAVYERLRTMEHMAYAIVENEGKSADKFTSVSNDLLLIKQYL
jgi:sugar phosphate isomerase/epimerase